MKRYWPLALIIIILQILAFMTSYFVTHGAVDGWYQTINKSSLNPPDWVFAPVWTILYTLLGVALWRMNLARALPQAKKALIFFLIQLTLNYAWSFIFFGMQAFTAAFVMLLLIDAFTIAAMIAIKPVDRMAVKLMIPYLAWVGFATWLTFEVMRLN